MSKGKIIGILYFGRQGRAKVVVDGWDEPISLAKGASGTALHGDSVELHILPPKKNKFERRKNKGKPAKLRYEVKKVVKRGTDEFLGYLKKDLGRSLVDAENSRLFIPFKILRKFLKINQKSFKKSDFSKKFVLFSFFVFFWFFVSEKFKN